ncbi:hypothetical protein GCM10009119_38020 [Algoriphagus jejuensis]|uniref:Uncharacterized protein n=1 Tax=Algoriphagus jejuensis TaxID=419934 RepID=A0ABP3YL73_9BACT
MEDSGIAHTHFYRIYISPLILYGLSQYARQLALCGYLPEHISAVVTAAQRAQGYRSELCSRVYVDGYIDQT